MVLFGMILDFQNIKSAVCVKQLHLRHKHVYLNMIKTLNKTNTEITKIKVYQI